MDSQCDDILAHLKKGRSITALEALGLFGCLRLAARIYDLKEAGHNIKDTFIKVRGKRVKRYALGSK